MKKTISIILSVMLLLAAFAPLAITSSAATPTGNDYVKIGSNYYESEEELKEFFRYNSGKIKDGDTIEVYGKVAIPLNPNLTTFYPETSYGATLWTRNYIWILSQSNVKVVGKTDDATLYFNGDIDAFDTGGAGVEPLQSLIIVTGDNIAFENLTIHAARNTIRQAEGYVSKSIELRGVSAVIRNCKFTPCNIAGAETLEAGNIQIHGQKDTVLIENNYFNKASIVFDSCGENSNIIISNNIFDSLREREGHADSNNLFRSNTWTTPPTISMGTILIKNNTILNVPEDCKNLVKQGLMGKYSFIDNPIQYEGQEEPDPNASIEKHFIIAKDSRINDETLSVSDFAAGVEINIIQGDKIINLTVSADGEINEPVELPSGLVIDKNIAFLKKGVTFDLTATNVNSLDKRAVVWSSSDESVATVNDGIVSVVGDGKAVITATIAGTNLSASCEVYVGNLTLDKETYSLNVNMRVTLEATLDIAYDGELPIVWKSSDTNVALVDQNGVVSAIRQGEVTITATISGTKISDSCTIYIGQAEKTQSIIDGILEFFRMIFEFLGGLFSGGER